MKTALVIGATGLVGSALVQLLLADPYFEKVRVFVRRSTKVANAKLEEHIIDFDQPQTWQHLVKGDVCYSTLGTTLKQAGGKDAQYKVDFTYQYQFAEAAARNQVPVYVLISADRANPDSIIFYSRMKGELERQVKQLPFTSIILIRPGLLVGTREQKRAGEKLLSYLFNFLNALGLFKRYKPIQGQAVAKAMLNASKAAAPGVQVYSAEKVFDLAK